MATSYYPRPDSFPALVCGFFANNPAEKLSIDDMVEAFALRSSANIHTQLSLSLEAKLLKRVRNEDGDYIYSKGPALTATSCIDAASEPAPAPGQKAISGSQTKRAKLDLSAIVIRDDVPCPSKYLRTGMVMQLMELINGLKKGQSFVLPIAGKSVMQKAVQKVHNTSKSKFSVRVDETAQQVGVWCDEKAES